MNEFYEERTTNENSNLFAKFNDEADKLRVWKVQTDFSIKMKDQRITELSQIINNLKTKLAHDQMDVKTLSLKLQQEEEYKKDVIDKNDANRELCNELMSCIARMNQQLEKAEGEKTDLKTSLNTYGSMLEDLSQKLKSLTLDTNEKNNSFTLLVKEKDDENKRLLAQLHSISSELQKLAEDGRAEMLNLKLLLDGSRNEIYELNNKMRSLKEKNDELENDLEEKNGCLKEASTSRSALESRCLDVEKHLCEMMSLNSQLESNIKGLSEENVVSKYRIKELEDRSLRGKDEMKACKSALSEKMVDFANLNSQLLLTLNKNILLENENIFLLTVFGHLAKDIQNYQFYINQHQIEFAELCENVSKNGADVGPLRENIINAIDELNVYSKTKCEKLGKLLSENVQQEEVIGELRKSCEMLKKEMLEAGEEKMKLNDLLKSLRADHDKTLLSQAAVFKNDLKEKQDRLIKFELDQINQNQKMEDLELECSRCFKQIEELSEEVSCLSKEKHGAEMRSAEIAEQLHSERDEYRKQLNSYEELISSLRLDLARTSSNLAFSLNKCKAEYDSLLRAQEAKIHRLESQFVLERQNLKNEEDGKSTTQKNASERTSYSDYKSWLDSDPIFGC